MAKHRLEITLDDEMWFHLDDARGHEPRASFVKRAVTLLIADTLEAKGGALHPPASEPVAEVLGSPVRKVPSIRDTWSR